MQSPDPGWGAEDGAMIFLFQMLLNILQEVLHRFVFSLVFKIISFGAQKEIFLAAWLNGTDSLGRKLALR